MAGAQEGRAALGFHTGCVAVPKKITHLELHDGRPSQKANDESFQIACANIK